MSNPLQDDYIRYPKSTRARTPRVAAIWQRAADRGVYHISQGPVRTVLGRPAAVLPFQGVQTAPSLHSWMATNLGRDGHQPALVRGISLVPCERESHILVHAEYAEQLPNILDAKRESDGLVVAIKWIPRAEHTRLELDVMHFLAGEELRSDPHNHCNPLLDTFPHPHDPNGVFSVTPWLANFVYAPLQAVSEVVDMLGQLLEVRRCRF